MSFHANFLLLCSILESEDLDLVVSSLDIVKTQSITLVWASLTSLLACKRVPPPCDHVCVWSITTFHWGRRKLKADLGMAWRICRSTWPTLSNEQECVMGKLQDGGHIYVWLIYPLGFIVGNAGSISLWNTIFDNLISRSNLLSHHGWLWVDIGILLPTLGCFDGAHCLSNEDGGGMKVSILDMFICTLFMA